MKTKQNLNYLILIKYTRSIFFIFASFLFSNTLPQESIGEFQGKYDNDRYTITISSLANQIDLYVMNKDGEKTIELIFKDGQFIESIK